MKKVELLLPAGNEQCLRAAVNNGADAVYLGLNRFNARASAGNFNEQNIASAIEYCHKKNVKVYVVLNTLIKNSEIKQYFELMDIAYQAKADAVIIQDQCLIPIIKKNFPSLQIHLSTQATITNAQSIPEGIDRAILARELTLDEIKHISEKHETEIFVHGALCFSYSGQCLFSSIVGGRSGNRGRCAQPCRLNYNNKYPLSTMDLCLVNKIPELIKAGVSSFKIEGRLRTPLYVATAARVYRKYIDQFYENKFNIDKKDIEDLMIAFNREFTCGFAFENSIVDSRKPMNRGIYAGQLKDGKVKLRIDLKLGDGIAYWLEKEIVNEKVTSICKEGCAVNEANVDDIVTINKPRFKESIPVYKTHSIDLRADLGEEIKPIKSIFKKRDIIIPNTKTQPIKDQPKLVVKVYNKKSAIEADKDGADIIYYDVYKEDCAEIKKALKHAKLFVSTPRILSDAQIDEIKKLIERIKPDGVLVGNKGLLKALKGYEMHLDYSFNVYNDIDINCHKQLPIISPELNFAELENLQNKNVIVLVHGNLVLMTTKEPLKAPELVDAEGRHFNVRNAHNVNEILNCKQLGLFSKVQDLMKSGFRYFYLDITDSDDVGRFTRIYKKIIAGEKFDDEKIKKGFTTGHFNKGVE
ncbi:MAG: U32 family peptidase [Candidatus Woesearchaeota archaeon]